MQGLVCGLRIALESNAEGESFGEDGGEAVGGETGGFSCGSVGGGEILDGKELAFLDGTGIAGIGVEDVDGEVLMASVVGGFVEVELADKTWLR